MTHYHHHHMIASLLFGSFSLFHLVIGGLLGLWLARRSGISGWFGFLVGGILPAGVLLMLGVALGPWTRREFPAR